MFVTSDGMPFTDIGVRVCLIFSCEISRSVTASIPYELLRSSMVRARRHYLPPSPRTLAALADMLSSDEFKHVSMTLDGEDNMYAGSGGDADDETAFVILASRRSLGELARCKKVFSDGTFCTPAGLECRQVWNLVKLRRHHVSLNWTVS